MKRTKLRKRSNPKTLLKKAHKDAWNSVREAVYRRDGHKCQVCGITPKILNADHWISRRNMATFYEINNLTTLCQRCHSLKTYQYADYDKKVDDVVLQREGKQVMDELRKKSCGIKKWSLEELMEIIRIANSLWV